MATCLIVQHVAAEGPCLLARSLADAGVDLDLRAVFGGDPVPEDAAGLDGVVVMGGPMSAASDRGFATRRSELALLADAVGWGVPTLGICLGAQLLALAAGGGVRTGDAGAEIGWGRVDLAPAAADDPLLAGLGGGMDVLHWHGETFSPPPAAVLLASSSRYANQAFRVGRRAWGFQFHVEVDLPGVRAFVEASGDEALAAGTDPGSIEAAAVDLLGADGSRRLPGSCAMVRFAELVRVRSIDAVTEPPADGSLVVPPAGRPRTRRRSP
jgi:GMP synthase-like glutamine amidotransferase